MFFLKKVLFLNFNFNLVASFHCGRKNNPLADVARFIVLAGGGSNLNTAFSNVYSCSKSSFESLFF